MISSQIGRTRRAEVKGVGCAPKNHSHIFITNYAMKTHALPKQMTEFKPFPKMARLSRECIITEKIDGTNASVYIGPTDFKTPNESVATFFKKDGTALGMWAGSRTRWITTANDNFGFAKWVVDNAPELFGLGEGHHFGEWWGSGIQRGYGFKNGERFFSLFNASRWVEHDKPTYVIENQNPKAPPKFTENAPACCKVVPILYEGIFDTAFVNSTLTVLGANGSAAAPNYMNPEGVVVYHVAGNVGFKKTIDNDEQPKGKQ